MQTSYLALLSKIDAVAAVAATIDSINIARTKTNKELDAIEAEYLIELKKKFKLVMDYYKENHAQLQDLQLRFGDEVRGLIRAGIEEIYRLGAKYAGRFLKEPSIFLSTANVATISRLADKSYDFFWRRINDLIRNYELEQAKQQTGIAAEGDDELDTEPTDPLDTASDLLFNSMSTVPLSIATIQKYNELRGNMDPLKPQPIVKVVFITKQDEKVCPICGPYHGTEWLTDDPFIIQPVTDTHPRCRCRLMLQTEEQGIFSG